MSDSCRLPESGRAYDDTSWSSGRRKAKGTATNAPSKTHEPDRLSCVSDAMYSTAKDSMDNDEANDEDDLMGDLVDELVLGDMNADDKQDFRMVSDAVQKRRIRRVQQTWQSIKKNVAAKTKAKAKAKAKAKGKGKGKGKGRVRKFLRP